jgi:hypothetical protein
VTTTPKHYADDPQTTTAPRASGWWLPVTRGEFDDRMNRLERILSSIDGHVVAVEEITTYIGEKVSEATDLLDAIDVRTNDLAAEVAELILKEQNRPDASPEVIARLQALKANLDGIAADPENPVPDPIPVDPNA